MTSHGRPPNHPGGPGQPGKPSEMWALPNGEVLSNVHPAADCEGRGCPIHHPSNHRMKDWPINWRSDARRMERTCPHGIGHPDPDDLEYRRGDLAFVAPGDVYADALHSCDGCCHV